MRSQFATSKQRGGRRIPSYAFSEQGVAMLSSVLHSPRAVQVNIEIMRTFVRPRKILASHADLAKQLAQTSQSYPAGEEMKGRKMSGMLICTNTVVSCGKL